MIPLVLNEVMPSPVQKGPKTSREETASSGQTLKPKNRRRHELEKEDSHGLLNTQLPIVCSLKVVGLAYGNTT